MTKPRNILLSVITRIVVCAALLAAAGGIFAILLNTGPEAGKTDKALIPRRVLVMQVKQLPVRQSWSGFGTAKALDDADIAARVSATVISVPVEIREGLAVSHGQLLVQLDESDFRRQMEMTAANLADVESQLARLDVEESAWKSRLEIARDEVKLAEAELARVNEAARQNAARERELDQARQALLTIRRATVAIEEEVGKIPARRASLTALRDGLRSSLEMAKQNVDRCRITSPIDGVLQVVDVKAGENVALGQRVARVVNLRRIEVPLLIAAGARPHVHVGDEVVLSAMTGEAEPWDATVTRIAPEDDQATRTMAVYVELEQEPSAARLLAPGQFVSGAVISREAQPRTLVPRFSLVGDRLLVIQDGLIASRAVETAFQITGQFPQLGVDEDQWAVLREALPDGTLVVLHPSRAILPGMRVDPVIGGESAPPAQMNGQAISTSRVP